MCSHYAVQPVDTQYYKEKLNRALIRIQPALLLLPANRLLMTKNREACKDSS